MGGRGYFRELGRLAIGWPEERLRDEPKECLRGRLAIGGNVALQKAYNSL